jgi:hypothetical protein
MQEVPAFVLCIENNAICDQALLLIESIRTFAGRYRDAEIFAIAPRPEFGVDEATRTRLDRLGATYHQAPLNTHCPQYGGANRLYAAAWAAEKSTATTLIVLDSDTLILREPELLGEEYDVAARPVDVKGSTTAGPGDEFEPYWQALCGLAGFPLKGLPFVETTMDRRQVRASYNGGYSVVRRDSGIMQRAAEIFTRSVAADIRPYKQHAGFRMFASTGFVPDLAAQYWGSSQAVLAVAAWSRPPLQRPAAQPRRRPILEQRLGGHRAGACALPLDARSGASGADHGSAGPSRRAARPAGLDCRPTSAVTGRAARLRSSLFHQQKPPLSQGPRLGDDPVLGAIAFGLAVVAARQGIVAERSDEMPGPGIRVVVHEHQILELETGRRARLVGEASGLPFEPAFDGTGSGFATASTLRIEPHRAQLPIIVQKSQPVLREVVGFRCQIASRSRRTAKDHSRSGTKRRSCIQNRCQLALMPSPAGEKEILAFDSSPSAEENKRRHDPERRPPQVRPSHAGPTGEDADRHRRPYP